MNFENLLNFIQLLKQIAKHDEKFDTFMKILCSFLEEDVYTLGGLAKKVCKAKKNLIKYLQILQDLGIIKVNRKGNFLLIQLIKNKYDLIKDIVKIYNEVNV